MNRLRHIGCIYLVHLMISGLLYPWHPGIDVLVHYEEQPQELVGCSDIADALIRSWVYQTLAWQWRLSLKRKPSVHKNIEASSDQLVIPENSGVCMGQAELDCPATRIQSLDHFPDSYACENRVNILYVFFSKRSGHMQATFLVMIYTAPFCTGGFVYSALCHSFL